MQFAGKTLFVGVLSLALAAPLLAQQMPNGGFRPPVFQANQQQAALNQGAQFGGFGGAPLIGPAAGITGAASLTSNPGGGGFGGVPSYYGAGASASGGGGSGYLGGSSQGYYAPPYTAEDPIGAYYRGVATLTVSYGKYIQDYQKGRLLNQEVERSRLVTRRQLIEELRYMQSLIPTSEDIRRLDWERDLARARKQAPIGDVLSGKSLNVLLTQLKQLHGKNQRGPSSTPLDEEMLKQINVSTKSGRNIGFIKSGKIKWPLALTSDAFAKSREAIDIKLEEAINRAKFGSPVDAVLMKDLLAAHKGLEDTLDRRASELTMSQYMEAKRCLSSLADGLRTLEDSDVQNYFNRKYEARGKSVPDLIDYMNREGLVFVNAVPGAEGPYRTLYNYLAAYEEAASGSSGGSR